MTQTCSPLYASCAVLKKHFWSLALPAAVASALLLVGNAAWAGNGPGGNEGVDDRGAVRLLKTVPIPGTAANTTNGKMYSFDISFVDESTQTYYLADRSNRVVDVVDAKTGTFTKQIPATPAFAGFTGNNDTSGPNGVVSAFPWLFVTDTKTGGGGGGRVVTIDLRSDSTVSDVSTGGTARADELAYDPQHGLLLVINNADSPPFGTLIKVDTSTGHLTVGAHITFTDATNGAEQPVWDP